MKTTYLALTVLLIMTLAFVVTCRVFDSVFANITIDYFAFFAGIFLVLEGIYKLFTVKPSTLPDRLFRTVRVVIGMCVFTIHLLQFMRY